MDRETQKEKTKNVQWSQWFAGIGVNLLLVQIGMIVLWSSPYITYLTSPESPIPMTMNEISWVVSILNLGRLAGSICGSVAVNYFGAKTAILMTSLNISFSWLLIIIANRAEWLYAARFVAGMSVGSANCCYPLYLGEIAEPTIRGALVALAMIGIAIGYVMISTMGAILSMKMSAAICFALSLILIIVFFWLPSSPYYFIKIKDETKARTSIVWYHRGCDVEAELQALKLFIEKNKSPPFIDIIKEFKIPYIWKALILSFVLFAYFQLSQSIVFYYMETILQNAQVTVIDPSVIVIIASATGIFASMLSIFLIDKIGRRILMIVSSLGITITLICLGVQYQLLDAGYDPTNLQALPIFSILFFQISSLIGIIPVPYTVLGEIFPPHIKCIASCFANLFGAATSFIATSTFQPLIDLITEKCGCHGSAQFDVSNIDTHCVSQPVTQTPFSIKY
ncbi:PREDICTED: facilitated trehalose transporter Tret1-like isoform X2 [Vollenhovia emeryi]|uniref:facilitated trehalose transporter Tret1-like isoform X2 n=1 Tax=Vollenhovia emeryi TaxID=411798 RepID=UPI0005F3D7E0|nr:PREDICTED: facilitated trehalose transporter Tret1-like isoform X2 [Vollenhovia emeryi]